MMTSVDKDKVDWQSIHSSLDDDGVSFKTPLLSSNACTRIRQFYDDSDIAFRSTIKMARYNFGRGEYKYFDYPLPEEISSLREYLYANLVPVANEWEKRLRRDVTWPANFGDLTKQCHAAGQCRPTPLLLRYREGDYNCLHQDLYGPIHFPLQVVIQLSKPDVEFEGGELILVEQRPRMQSRPIVARLAQGEAAIIPVRERPRLGTRGYHRAPMRHGVGEVTKGERLTLGMIFHDAA